MTLNLCFWGHFIFVSKAIFLVDLELLYCADFVRRASRITVGGVSMKNVYTTEARCLVAEPRATDRPGILS